MKFRTEIDIKPLQKKLNPNELILFMGSCFSENMGKKMIDAKIPVNSNLYGTLFHPLSILNCLQDVLSNYTFSPADFFIHEEIWNSFKLHSSLSSPDLERNILTLNTKVVQAHQEIRNAKFLSLTFGSAYIYTHLPSQQKVANCHKLPSSLFSKSLSEPEEIIQAYTETISSLLKLNPSLHIIFSVSPVLHIKDGIVENNLSKSICIYCAHEIVKRNPQCIYFPSYELIHDDLRDYRFYKSDLLHPSEQAVEYVFEKFKNFLCSDSLLELMEKTLEIKKMIAHRPFQKNTDAFKSFLKAGLLKCEALQAQHPFLNLKEEIEYFEQEIRAETK